MLQKLRGDRGGFTLVEIMVVVAILGLLAAIAVPGFIRARARSQATSVLNELRMLDAAMDQYALENNKTGNATAAWADVTPYLKAGSKLASNGGNDLLGNPYGFDITISAGIHANSATQATLSDATGGGAFWGPYS